MSDAFHTNRIPGSKMEIPVDTAVLAPVHDGRDTQMATATVAPSVPGDLGTAGNENRVAKISIPALTGIRFFAAFLVILYHFWFLNVSWMALTPSWIAALIRIGSIGVGIFFTLSGYILMTVYANADFKRAAVRRDFWVARFARVYPAYVLSLLLTTPFVLGHRFAGRTPLRGTFDSIVSFGTSAIMIQAWIPKLSRTWNGPGWSLSAEAFFYLAFPLIALKVSRLSTVAKWRTLLGCWIVLMAACAVLSRVAAGEGLIQLLTLPPLQLCYFLAGACLASLPHFHELRILQIVRGDAATGIGCLAILCAAMGADRVGSVLVTQGLLLPAYLLLIRGLSTGGVISSILSRRPFVILGEASYSMYLFQFPIWWFSISLMIGLDGDLVTALFNQQFPATNWLFAVNLTGLVVASGLCWKYLETPMRTAIRRNFAGHSSAR